MNPSPQTPPQPSRPPCRRWLRRAVLCLAALVVLVAAFYAEEDWRGARAWNQYRQSIEARGESLDLRTYIPKPVPDDQNFLATPFLKALFPTNAGEAMSDDILTNDIWFGANKNITQTNISKDWGRLHFTDLVAWQLAFSTLQNGPLDYKQSFETTNTSLAARAAAAPAVLAGMEPDAAVFAELRAASARQYSVCPVPYDLEDLTPKVMHHQIDLIRICQRLNLEGCAELAAGQSDNAMADVKLMFSLAESLKSESYLTSYLARRTCLRWVIQPVWEGLAEHRWNDAQLQELQKRFLACDSPGEMYQSLEAERAYQVFMADQIKKEALFFEVNAWPPASASARRIWEKALPWAGRIIPAGWYDQQKLKICRVFEAQYIGLVGFKAKKVSTRNAPPDTDKSDEQFRSSSLRDSILHSSPSLMLPYYDPVNFTAAVSQTTANQAALACALERYRLANGQFPKTLDALTPQFIAHPPNDVITGQPYKYRLATNGQFILYSVGWNEKDDGGVPGKELFDKTQGDWVWEYPAE